MHINRLNYFNKKKNNYLQHQALIFFMTIKKMRNIWFKKITTEIKEFYSLPFPLKVNHNKLFNKFYIITIKCTTLSSLLNFVFLKENRQKFYQKDGY